MRFVAQTLDGSVRRWSCLLAIGRRDLIGRKCTADGRDRVSTVRRLLLVRVVVVLLRIGFVCARQTNEAIGSFAHSRARLCVCILPLTQQPTPSKLRFNLHALCRCALANAHKQIYSRARFNRSFAI